MTTVAAIEKAMPRPSVRTAVIVKARALTRERSARRRSLRKWPMRGGRRNRLRVNAEPMTLCPHARNPAVSHRPHAADAGGAGRHRRQPCDCCGAHIAADAPVFLEAGHVRAD